MCHFGVFLGYSVRHFPSVLSVPGLLCRVWAVLPGAVLGHGVADPQQLPRLHGRRPAGIAEGLEQKAGPRCRCFYVFLASVFMVKIAGKCLHVFLLCFSVPVGGLSPLSFNGFGLVFGALLREFRVRDNESAKVNC